ncbi:MAG: FAD:protein FMN transferase [Bacteroidetes bacterium]|nr:FAD:protein FMN transferase [Bacteroidota bacterium]
MGNSAVYKKELKLMGNQFQLSVVAADAAWAMERIDAGVREIQRIEALLSTFREDSETNRINGQAGIAPVKVSRETFHLIARAQRLSALTQGAFDLSYGSVDKRLWNFDTTMKSLPDRETARKMVQLINYRNIVLDEEESTVFLRNKGMRIGFGGIGKGYAAERAKAVMQDMGVESGIVNASGDLAAWGSQPDGSPWTIGIVHPDTPGHIFSSIAISGKAVATSGNYEKYVMIGGKRYSHTIDPRTGLPVTGIKSVTIITPNAELADAMATPVMIMGIRAGLDMINQVRDMEAILIDDDNSVHATNNIRFT